jgi:hypothetical protein
MPGIPGCVVVEDIIPVVLLMIRYDSEVPPTNINRVESRTSRKPPLEVMIRFHKTDPVAGLIFTSIR